MAKKDSVSFQIETAKKEKIEELAKKERRSISQIIQLIIDDYLEKETA